MTTDYERGFAAGVEAAALRCEEHADYLRTLAQSTTIDPSAREADAIASDFCAELIRRIAPTSDQLRPCARCGRLRHHHPSHPDCRVWAEPSPESPARECACNRKPNEPHTHGAGTKEGK